MIAFLIDSIFGYISWLILMLIIISINKLIKKESLKTINFKLVFIISLIGIISPTISLLNGRY
jgi:hypothetical protein